MALYKKKRPDKYYLTGTQIFKTENCLILNVASSLPLYLMLHEVPVLIALC